MDKKKPSKTKNIRVHKDYLLDNFCAVEQILKQARVSNEKIFMFEIVLYSEDNNYAGFALGKSRSYIQQNIEPIFKSFRIEYKNSDKLTSLAKHFKILIEANGFSKNYTTFERSQIQLAQIDLAQKKYRSALLKTFKILKYQLHNQDKEILTKIIGSALNGMNEVSSKL